jgi:CcmD family protein
MEIDMGNVRKKLSLILLSLLALPSLLFAQSENGIDMAETMRSEGKIYVVILVVAIVFSGLVIFAINSDRKISKLEKEIKSLKSDKDS